MKITYAISNWIYGEEPLENQFARLSKFGYDAIEVMVGDPATFDTGEVKRLMEGYGLPCCSICTMMTGAAEKPRRRNLVDPDPEVRRQTVQYLKGCIDAGVELGARLVLTVPSGVANTADGWTEENRTLCVDALLELGDHAKSTGDLLVAIEPINRYENAFLQRCEQALELIALANHPRVKVMLDFFHANIEENNNGDAIRMAGGDLVHCHIADSNRKSTGRGQTDWFEVMRALRDVDFVGALACEPLPPTGADVYESLKGTRPEADLYAKECIEYLKFVESVVS
ncbi:MAG: sugar phosphate isomerase/epimerase family protein [Promethearchaeota archaeon]